MVIRPRPAVAGESASPDEAHRRRESNSFDASASTGNALRGDEHARWARIASAAITN
jgi:hypothetical protein